MKVIEVKIALGGGYSGETWTQSFSDYPSLETIRLRLRGSRGRDHSNIPELAEEFSDGDWAFLENPDRWVQGVWKCGVCLGRIEMAKKNVYVCGNQQILKPQCGVKT